jgi:hypothetical protein
LAAQETPRNRCHRKNFPTGIDFSEFLGKKIPRGKSWTRNFFWRQTVSGEKKTGPTLFFLFFLAQEFDRSAISCDFPAVQIPVPPNGA